MSFLANLLGNTELVTFTVSFDRAGNYSVQESTHLPISPFQVTEVLSLYYLKTLFMVGRSRVSDLIVDRFSSFASEMRSGRLIEVNLLDILNELDIALDMGFNLQSHLKISDMMFVPNVPDLNATKHKVVLLQRKSRDKFIETHPSPWQNKVYIPLALFAFLQYCLHKYFTDSVILRKVFAASIIAVHQKDQFQGIHQTSNYASLSNYVDEYFTGFEQGLITLQ